MQEGSLAQECYQVSDVKERHRHRWEVNPAYVDRLQAKGMRVSGKSPDGTLVEIVEVADHPFYVAVQFHPELKSRPERPHPLFNRFVGATLARQYGNAGSDAGTVRS